MPDPRILMGVIGRPHGVRGLVHVHSYTADPEDLTAYGVLTDESGRAFTLRWEREGIARLSKRVDGRDVPIRDREEAAVLTNTRLYVSRSMLPAADEDEYYLTDLIGLRAEDQTGRVLGTVALVHDYGAGTSLEIAPSEAGASLLLPFTAKAVPVVDIAGGRIVIDPPEAVDGEPQGAEAQALAAEATERQA